MKESPREGCEHLALPGPTGTWAALSMCRGAAHNISSVPESQELKEAAPVLSKREGSLTASQGPPQQQRQQEEPSLDCGTKSMFGNSSMRVEKVCTCRSAMAIWV